MCLNCEFHVYVLVKFHGVSMVILVLPIWLFDFWFLSTSRQGILGSYSIRIGLADTTSLFTV
jgi:hypothetical protein